MFKDCIYVQVCVWVTYVKSEEKGELISFFFHHCNVILKGPTTDHVFAREGLTYTYMKTIKPTLIHVYLFVFNALPPDVNGDWFWFEIGGPNNRP